MTIRSDDWRRILIAPNCQVMTAIEKIDQEGLRVLIVVDANDNLLGVVTDGDIRRHLLRCSDLSVPVREIMNKQPKFATETSTKSQLLTQMQQLNILHLPILNKMNQVVGLETLNSLTEKKHLDNWVVFMAGGLGTRLHPLTLDFPKPLVKIGSKPMLEILLENFIENGFHHFYFSVNYKADLIKNHFADGEKWGVEIRYLQEENALGTVGSLNLLPALPSKPFFVVNADIMTNLKFDQILEFHQFHANHPLATVCVREYENTIPYGVMHIDRQHHGLMCIDEKPTHRYFVNAGIYVLNPEIFDHLPIKKAYYDMPNLLDTLVKNKKFVATFPIREYWLDIGSHENLSRATLDYEKIFV